jgi:hypothetical protein
MSHICECTYHDDQVTPVVATLVYELRPWNVIDHLVNPQALEHLQVDCRREEQERGHDPDKGRRFVLRAHIYKLVPLEAGDIHPRVVDSALVGCMIGQEQC